MALQHSPSIVTNGLIVCLDTGNPRSYPGSGTRWFDVSSSGFIGTNTATTYTSGINGYFAFNGTSSNVQVPITGSPSLFNFQVAIQNYKAMPPNTNMGPYYSAVGFTANGYSTIGLNLGEWTGAATNETVSWWHYGVAQGSNYITDTIDANFNIYTFNWNGTTYDIWINGTKRTISSFGTMSLITNLTNISIGYNQGWAYWFLGNIASISLYNRQLTDSEVTQNFNAIRTRFNL